MKSKYDIIWLDCVDSTNEEAKRRICNLDNLSVLSAKSQSAGRGQAGNSWHSEPGKNLLFSIVLKEPGIQAYDQFIISQTASLSIVDLLALHGINASIKWPNDIYVDGKKICGILIENTIQGKWINSSIIGIGLNINQRNFDVSLPNPTSMAICNEEDQENFHPYDISSILEEFMSIFTEYLDRFCNIGGGYNRLGRLYHSQLWRLNQPAEFIDMRARTSPTLFGPDTCIRFHGIIRGTTPIGHLLVEASDGKINEFAFKEIVYIP